MKKDFTKEDIQLLHYLQSFLTPHRVALFDKVIEERTRHFTVVTEDVGQLHNTSAVMRSCEAFGIQDVHIIEEIHGKRIDKEIALGAQKWTTIYRHKSTRSAIRELKNSGYRIVATTPHHTSHTLHDFKIDKPAALLFGKEQEGLSDYAIEAADEFIYIPTYGFTQSLNISVSAAIIIQHLMHKLRTSLIKWSIPDNEQKQLKLQWTKNNIKNIEMILARFEQSKI